MVTLKDIADVTGVSISTVSRVMSGKGKISEETKRKVLSASEELMFKRGAAESAFPGKKRRVGILIPASGEYYNDDPASSTDLRSLRTAFELRGDSTVLLPMDAFDPEALMTAIRTQALDGVIVSDPGPDPSMPRLLKAKGIPALIVNGVFPSGEFCQADYDNEGGMDRMAELVLAKGHLRVAVLAGPESHMVSQNRMAGLRAAFSRCAVGLPEEAITWGPFSMDSGYDRCGALLSGESSFTAVIAFNDYLALGAMRAIKDRGLRIPQDIAITGFDDIEFARFADPPLTTVRRYSEHAATMVATLFDSLADAGTDLAGLECRFQTNPVLRGSL